MVLAGQWGEGGERRETKTGEMLSTCGVSPEYWFGTISRAKFTFLGQLVTSTGTASLPGHNPLGHLLTCMGRGRGFIRRRDEDESLRERWTRVSKRNDKNPKEWEQ